MARHALDKITGNDPVSIKLMKYMFGLNHLNHWNVRLHFEIMAGVKLRRGYVIACDDQMVHLEVDMSDPLNTRIMYVDRAREWAVPQDLDKGCNSVNGPPILSYSIDNRYIYVCPLVLDNLKGRSLLPYRYQVLAGSWIEDYMLLPAVLFNALLSTQMTFRKYSFRPQHYSLI